MIIPDMLFCFVFFLFSIFNLQLIKFSFPSIIKPLHSRHLTFVSGAVEMECISLLTSFVLLYFIRAFPRQENQEPSRNSLPRQTPDTKQHNYCQRALREKGNVHTHALLFGVFMHFWVIRLNILVERCFLGSLNLLSNLTRTNIALVLILTRIHTSFHSIVL